MAPNQIRELDLADKMADLGIYGPIEEAGVDITYSGAPGGVIASLTSSDPSGDYAIEVPIKDPADMMHMSQGSYPWTLEAGNKTVLHLKNTTNQLQQASILIRFAGGMYKPDLINLKPHQTVPLDIASLKKSQKKDVTGAVFPKNANSGTVVWSELISKTLIGRAEQLNIAQGTARSFSCQACPCPSNMNSTAMNPNSFTASVGYSGNPFAPVYTTEDCNNWTYGPYSAPPPLTWSSQNTSIATVSGSGNVNLIEPGTTAILAQFTTTVSFPPTCQTQQINPQPGGPVNSTPTISGGSTVWWFNGATPAGYPTSVTLTSSGGSSTTWKVTGGASEVNLSTTTGTSTNVTSSGTAWSSKTGDVTITATANGMTSSPFSLTTLKPASLTAPSVFTQCDSNFGYETDISYEIVDQLTNNLPATIDWNEKFTTGATPVYTNTNWPQNPVSPGTADFSSLVHAPLLLDVITGPGVNNVPANIPQPTCNATPSVEVVKWGQTFSVGSQTTGAGAQVQSDTLHKWIDHGAHTIP